MKTELKELVGENKELKIMARKLKSLLRELNETKTSIKDTQANKVAADEEEKDLRKENILLEEKMKAVRVFSGTA